MDFGRKHRWIASERVARRSEQHHFAETNRSRLVKEGTAFFGSGHSGEPIVVSSADFGGRRGLA